MAAPPFSLSLFRNLYFFFSLLVARDDKHSHGGLDDVRVFFLLLPPFLVPSADFLSVVEMQAMVSFTLLVRSGGTQRTFLLPLPPFPRLSVVETDVAQGFEFLRSAFLFCLLAPFFILFRACRGCSA